MVEVRLPDGRTARVLRGGRWVAEDEELQGRLRSLFEPGSPLVTTWLGYAPTSEQRQAAAAIAVLGGEITEAPEEDLPDGAVT